GWGGGGGGGGAGGGAGGGGGGRRAARGLGQHRDRPRRTGRATASGGEELRARHGGLLETWGTSPSPMLGPHVGPGQAPDRGPPRGPLPINPRRGARPTARTNRIQRAPSARLRQTIGDKPLRP